MNWKLYHSLTPGAALHEQDCIVVISDIDGSLSYCTGEWDDAAREFSVPLDEGQSVEMWCVLPPISELGKELRRNRAPGDGK